MRLPVAVLLLPLRRLLHAELDEADEQRREPAEYEHPSPAEVGADEVVRDRCEEEPEVIARVHQASADLSLALGQLLRKVGRSDWLFTADPEAHEHAQDRELPDVVDQPAHERE